MLAAQLSHDVSFAFEIWALATIGAMVTLFALRLPAAGLALMTSLLGTFFGMMWSAAVMGTGPESLPFGAAVGASLGLALGGMVGLAYTWRVPPRIAASAVGWLALGVALAGTVVTWWTAAWLHGCWADPYCHFPTLLGLILIDAVILAVVLTIVAAHWSTATHLSS